MTSLQILTLLSYLALVAVGAENILVWYLTIYHRDKARWVGLQLVMCSA
jgi:hypothetical protein